MIKKGGRVNHILIKTVNKGIEDLRNKIPDKKELITFYEHHAKDFYRRNYVKLKEEPLLRELYMNPKTKYLKFVTLAQILFPLLDGMDLYVRYPMPSVGYNNVRYLDRLEIRGACLLLGEMVGELVSLAPLVWNKIESLKPS